MVRTLVNACQHKATAAMRYSFPFDLSQTAVVASASGHPPALVANVARLGRVDLAWADVVFFSFMTLTTVGYGDVTPVSPEARMVARCEAAAGGFFLAFLVARLVGLYRADEPADHH